MKISLKPGAAASVYGGAENSGLTGTVKFYQKGKYVLVVCEISGLPKDTVSGFFALHIHEGDSCEGDDFAFTGGHYNPQKAPHPRHAGDLPPLLSCGGEAYMSVLTDRFTVSEITGKTIVIHSQADDFKTQPSGNAGKKIACGVIKQII